MNEPFWQTKSLGEMSEVEFEALCDGCGKCCLHKVIDDDTEELYFTDIACQLLDRATGRCRDYANRLARVSDCFRIDPTDAESFGWLPPSCAYRRIAEGRGLASWHPLVSGSTEAMVAAGMTVRYRSVSEKGRYRNVDRIVTWPLEDID